MKEGVKWYVRYFSLGAEVKPSDAQAVEAFYEAYPSFPYTSGDSERAQRATELWEALFESL